ncbi:hypothetical protein FACS1894106_5430 [Spirochaetia bacterium]|nr:hypothetical protein FACS1894106_5430 [Spirochaetia bacterium]
MELAHKYSELIRYGIVGAGNTLFNFLLFWLLSAAVGIQYLIANILTWVMCVFLSFLANKYFVFRKNSGSGKGFVMEMMLFFGTRAATGAFDTLFLWIMVDALHVDKMISKIFSTVFVIIINYVTAKLFVFRKEKLKLGDA